MLSESRNPSPARHRAPMVTGEWHPEPAADPFYYRIVDPLGRPGLRLYLLSEAEAECRRRNEAN